MGNNSSRWDKQAYLEATSTPQLEKLLKWWEARAESAVARDQMARIKAIIASRIGKTAGVRRGPRAW
jgi:hypothetical protein